MWRKTVVEENAMNKNFKYYLSVWTILLVLFNVVTFVVPRPLFGGAFWSGYIFITLAFIGQLVCGYVALKEENIRKLFYNFPILSISYTGLILTSIFGIVCMVIPGFPIGLSIIICFAILCFTVIFVLKAKLAADVVEAVDEKIKVQTFFIKSLAVDAEGLMVRAKTDVAKAECKKVYEAIRYSDPMSKEELNVCEAKITVKFDEFSNAVALEKDNIKDVADELVALIEDRNRKCKVMK